MSFVFGVDKDLPEKNARLAKLKPYGEKPKEEDSTLPRKLEKPEEEEFEPTIWDAVKIWCRYIWLWTYLHVRKHELVVDCVALTLLSMVACVAYAFSGDPSPNEEILNLKYQVLVLESRINSNQVDVSGVDDKISYKPDDIEISPKMNIYAFNTNPNIIDYSKFELDNNDQKILSIPEIAKSKNELLILSNDIVDPLILPIPELPIIADNKLLAMVDPLITPIKIHNPLIEFPKYVELDHVYKKSSNIISKNRKLDSADIDLLIAKYPWYASERELLIEQAKTTNIDMMLVFAIGQLESCNGANGIGSKRNNIWGHMSSKGKLIKYDSKASGILAHIRLLEKYNDRGRDTIDKASRTYNPGSPKYINNVVNMMNMLTKYLNKERLI